MALRAVAVSSSWLFVFAKSLGQYAEHFDQHSAKEDPLGSSYGHRSKPSEWVVTYSTGINGRRNLMTRGRVLEYLKQSCPIGARRQDYVMLAKIIRSIVVHRVSFLGRWVEEDWA